MVFRYVSPTGDVDPEFHFTGSARAIGRICNARGNVLGLMPHPERCTEEVLGNTDGLALFQGLLSVAARPFQTAYGGGR